MNRNADYFRLISCWNHCLPSGSFHIGKYSWWSDPTPDVLCSYGIKSELRDDACFSRIAHHYVASYLLWNEAENDEANHAWLKQANDLLRPYSKGTYVNEIEATRYPERIKSSFSDKSWKRLAELRKKYDPDNVFHTYLGYS